MNTLFISTYSDIITIGLLNNGKEITKKEKESHRGHSELIVPTIDEILKENNLTPKDLNEIIVVSGPGSFTGVRLGITVAKTLAYTLNIPIKEITSIEAISASINEENKIIYIDDPKGKYIGEFQNNKLTDLFYLKDEDAKEYLNKTSLSIYETSNLNLESIYKYSLNINPTPAHAVKAVYIKGIEALNGK